MIKYRPATQKDFCHLQEVERSAGRIFNDYSLEKLAKDEPLPVKFYATLPENSAIYIAESQNQIIGFAIVLEKDNNAYLREISVHYNYGRQGVGTGLLKKTEDWAIEQGYDYMTLTTFKELPFNGLFYQKQGYKEFLPSDEWPYIQYVRKMEREKGIDIIPRVAMRKKL